MLVLKSFEKDQIFVAGMFNNYYHELFKLVSEYPNQDNKIVVRNSIILKNIISS